MIAADGSVTPLYLVTPISNTNMQNRFTCMDSDPDTNDRLYGGGTYTTDTSSEWGTTYPNGPRSILAVKATSNSYSDQADWKWAAYYNYP